MLLLRQSFPQVVSPLLMAVVVVVVILSVLVWSWAVRRPALSGEASERAPVPLRPITYAAIGASDVVGEGANDPAGESWVNVLHEKLPEGSRLVRLGRGGITLREANSLEVPQAIAALPDLVTLWNCVNDATGGVTLDAYLQDLNEALSRLTGETHAQVLLLNMPDIGIVTATDEEQRELVRGGVLQWNAAIANVAAGFGERVQVVDLFPASAAVLERPDYLSPDHFHPSTAGYRRLAEVVWDVAERTGVLERAGRGVKRET